MVIKPATGFAPTTCWDMLTWVPPLFDAVSYTQIRYICIQMYTHVNCNFVEEYIWSGCRGIQPWRVNARQYNIVVYCIALKLVLVLVLVLVLELCCIVLYCDVF